MSIHFSCVVCGHSVDGAVLSGLFVDWESLVDVHVCSPKCFAVWNGVDVVECELPVFSDVDVGLSSLEQDVSNIKNSISMMRNVFNNINDRISSLENQLGVVLSSSKANLENTKKYMDIMDKQLRLIEDGLNARLGGMK